MIYYDLLNLALDLLTQCHPNSHFFLFALSAEVQIGSPLFPRRRSDGVGKTY